jgi:hypothetical protein
MAIRFVEVRLPIDVHEETNALTESFEVVDRWAVPSGIEEIHQYLMESQNVEPLVDAIRSRLGENRRIIAMPVEATMPR